MSEEIEECNVIFTNEQVSALADKLKEQQQEIERLHSIIKEVREYIKSKQYKYWDYEGKEYIQEDMFEKDTNPQELLEILDKENK